ncbi:MAG: butyryl-CoA dehydrogenase, partial [Blastocatellia bacterium]
MIDFQLTEEHLALQRTVREFVTREVAPYIKQWDENEHFERSVFDKMADLGLLGVCIPEHYGGAGFDYVSLGIVCEELEACDTFMRVAMSVHVGLNSLSIYSWATEEQKQKYLVPQARGERLATFGLTEPNAGSDVVGMRSYAVRDGDDWILNGSKLWISGADTADFGIVFARTDPSAGRAGITAFIVDKDMPGFQVRRIVHVLRSTDYPTELTFDNVRVPSCNVVGEVGGGFALANERLTRNRVPYAAGCIGVAVAAQHMAIEYSKHRVVVILRAE